MKYYYLCTLIHQPFLCLPLLQINNQPFINLLIQYQEQITKAEWNCVHKAQQTIHLLYHITDKQSLVHDFPWWQIISYLICISSILFIAESYYNYSSGMSGRTSSQSLREDVEICLKVFNALSINSAAAQKTADILAGLSRIS